MQSNLRNRTLFCRDNLEVMMGMDTESIDLIYLDPPFNKNKKFTAPIGSKAEGASFSDIFRKEDIKDEWIEELKEENEPLANYIESTGSLGKKYNRYYLVYMARRLMEMHRLLKPTGSLYLHCDPTMSHYLKLLMDSLFGEDHFRNEIVWGYGGRGMAKRWFNRKHDTIFYYSKTAHTPFYDKEALRPLNNKYTHRYNKTDKSGRKYARVLNQDGSYSDIYLKEEGVVREDWWVDIPFTRGKEYLGYPTQKPLRLLERIIKASTQKNDIVLDPFCGCATTCVAAEQLDRQWIGIDVSPLAYELVRNRLKKEVSREGEVFQKKVIYREGQNAVLHRTDLKACKLSIREMKSILYGNQHGKCNGCSVLFPYVNLTLDHIFPQSKGGAHHIDNMQLLCHRCNSIKGDRGMEYLKSRLKEIRHQV